MLMVQGDITLIIYQMMLNPHIYDYRTSRRAEDAYKAYCDACIKYHREFSNIK